MAVVDTLVTEYILNADKYKQGASHVMTANQQIGSGLEIGAGLMFAFAGAVTAVAGAFVTLGYASLRKAAEFDAMVKALEAVVGGAEAAKTAIEELRDIAKLPGLGLEEAIKGYSSLRRAGLDNEFSMRVIRSAGNANALASGGREELGRVLTAIQQIAMKPNLSGEELLQLTEAGLPAAKIIKDAFGTIDGAQLKKLGIDSKQALEALVEGLERMPKAGESLKNSLENLAMAADLAMTAIGMGLATGVAGGLKELSDALSSFEESGAAQMFGEALAELAHTAFPELEDGMGGLSDAFVNLAALSLDVAQGLGNLKMNLQDMSDLWAKGIKANPFIGPIVGILENLGAIDNGGPVKSAGQLYKDEIANRKHAEKVSEGKRDKSDAKAEAAQDTAEAAKDAALATARATERTAAATEKLVELQKSVIGGSAYGDAAISPVNMSGGAPVGSRGAAIVGDMIAALVNAQVRTAVGRR